MISHPDLKQLQYTNECNQTSEFGQLIEYNERDIFPQKSCRK